MYANPAVHAVLTKNFRALTHMNNTYTTYGHWMKQNIVESVAKKQNAVISKFNFNQTDN